MAPGDGPKCRGDCEGNEEIRNREKLFPLSVEPHTGLVVLAFRAAPVAARVREMDDLGAVRALDDYFPGGGGPTLENVVHGPNVCGANPGAVFCLESVSIFLDQAGKFHRSNRHDLEAVHDGVDGLGTVLERRFGQAGIYGGGERAGMAEDVLDKPKLDTSLDKVRGKAVTEGMDADALGNASIPEGSLEGLLDAAPVHVGVCNLDGFRRTKLVWEEEARVPVGFPELPEGFVGDCRQGNKSIFASFPIPDVDLHFGFVDVPDTKVETFSKTEACCKR